MPPRLVILAAGASQRLGRCKALVQLGKGTDSTPLASLAKAGREAGGEAALVITGKHHGEIAAFVERAGLDVELLRNEDWAAGRTGSVRAAQGALSGRDLLLAPVDVPRVPARVFAALWAGWRKAGAPARGWLAPCFRSGERMGYGHPVLLGRGLLERLGQAWGQAPLRALRKFAEPCWGVEVDSGAILEDLDTPTDLARMRGEFGD